jgi:hypothetical protein
MTSAQFIKGPGLRATEGVHSWGEETRKPASTRGCERRARALVPHWTVVGAAVGPPRPCWPPYLAGLARPEESPAGSDRPWGVTSGRDASVRSVSRNGALLHTHSSRSALERRF